MSACEPSGYYDSNGQYRSYGASDSYRHDNAMGGTAPTTTVVTYPSNNAPYNADGTFTRAGYYDHNGYYIAADSGPRIPEGYFPPRGMCRIWFTDRPAGAQPGIESCAGIRSRVPEGAYVVYGG